MADDKGGGGSSWSALEIIVGIVLLIGLLDRFSATIPGAVNPASKTVGTTEKNSQSTCGLTLYSPSQNQKVSRDVVVEGMVGTCNWEVENDIALFAQVIDAKGKPLSDYVPIAPRDLDKRGKVDFVGTVPVLEIPTTKTGYLILVPAKQSRTRYTTSTRVPISFQ